MLSRLPQSDVWGFAITKYIHGYTTKEQNRLLQQSHFLESYIYTNIDFSNCDHMIEIGCGVGAQIQLLLNRWPHLKITGADISEAQISCEAPISQAASFCTAAHFAPQPRVWRLLLERGGWIYLFQALPANATSDQRPLVLAVQESEKGHLLIRSPQVSKTQSP